MQPIQELLNRIKWDETFGAGFFEIGYFDRVAHEIIRVPLHKLFFESGDHFAFQSEDASGERVTIPFHRVREVRKNGEVIWQRTREE